MASVSVFKANNIAVITGGASGIGLALATKCAGYGMSVIIVGKYHSYVLVYQSFSLLDSSLYGTES